MTAVRGIYERILLISAIALAFVPCDTSAAVDAARSIVQPATDVMPPVQRNELRLDGDSIYYELSGQGRPVVLLHDGLLHNETWDLQVPALEARLKVIRFDRRGYGASSPASGPFSDVDDLLALLDHLDVSQTILVGCSSGGALAIDFAIAHPDRVEALVLVGPIVGGMGFSNNFILRNRGLIDEDPAVTIENLIDDPYHMAAMNQTARDRFAALLRANPQNTDFSRWQFARQPDVPAIDHLNEIDVPTLIIVGAADHPDVHAHCGALQAGIAGCERVVLPQSGHLVHMEKPAAFNEIVGRFLARCAPPAGAPGVESDIPHRDASGYIRVAGGAVFYEVFGEAEPLVLIHGGAIDRRMWDDQVAPFAQRYQVIRYDARGHGLSPAAPGPRHDHEDLHQVLTQLGISEAHLCGLSMGGGTAIDFALEHPNMVRSLVLVGPGLSGYEFVGDDYRDFLGKLREAYGREDFDAAIEQFLGAWTVGPHRQSDEVSAAVRERVHTMLTDGFEPARNQGWALGPDPPAIERLSEISAPTLVILGEEDMSDIHAIVARMGSELQGARTVTVPDAAHMVNMEQPLLFNRLVLDFLADVDANAAAQRDQRESSVPGN